MKIKYCTKYFEGFEESSTFCIFCAVPNWRNNGDQTIDVRETGVSQHQGDPIDDPPLDSSNHNRTIVLTSLTS